MSYKVSFIGLGVMGYPMAGFISKAGHDVTVFNRTKAKAEKWVKEYKGKAEILLLKQQKILISFLLVLETMMTLEKFLLAKMDYTIQLKKTLCM